MSNPTANVKAYFNELHRKSCILQSLIEVVADRIEGRTDPDRDFVVDNLLDVAREVSRELPIMALEDPAHWEDRP
ncbi:MAG: hypothetical protein M9895_15245 [Aquamicrobium sp.]|uniref:hypothetical protein n=1 Tax=Aquamicrobium sp. TaxID=1872579 RepID=UPI00349E7128|nr:hypothetical protein [Aquamicrobium sp.]